MELTRENPETEHTEMQINVSTKSIPNKTAITHSKKPVLRERTDRAWFSSALYDIWSGNGAGVFLQSRAHMGQMWHDTATRGIPRGQSTDEGQHTEQ